MSFEVPHRDIPLGDNGRSIIKQLRGSGAHANDGMQPKDLLEHICRTDGEVSNKPEACPGIDVALCAGGLAFSNEVCGKCRTLFLANMGRTG